MGIHLQTNARKTKQMRIFIQVFRSKGHSKKKNLLKIKGKKLLNFEWESDTRELPEELVPYKVKEYDLPFPTTVDEALAQVDGLKSLVNPDVQAEGIVWWNTEGKAFEELGFRPNFKAINNSYL